MFSEALKKLFIFQKFIFFFRENKGATEIFDLEDNWYLMLLAMILNDRRINEYFEERNLDSIILGELEVLINRDLSIIGGIRLIKEARQSWE